MKLVNGISPSTSAGKKRGIDEASGEDSDVESPPKRQRALEGETSPHFSTTSVSKSPLIASINGEISKKSPAQVPFRIRPFASLNGNHQSQQEVPRKPYSPKRMPPDFSKSTPSLKPDSNKEHPKYSTLKQIPRPPKPRPLQLSQINPYAEDPFYDAAVASQQRHAPRRFTGIAPAFTPGANRAFSRETEKERKQAALGIKTKRKDMMRT